MGLPNTSRKGKKAWRKNIDDTEIVEAVQKETHQQRRGPAVESLQDSQLFFEDKGTSAAETQVRTRPKKEKRPTRAQLILQAPQAITAVTSYKNPKRKSQPLPPPRQLQKQAEPQQQELSKPARKKQKAGKGKAVNTALDIWEEQPEEVIDSREAPKVLSTVGPTSRAGVGKNRPLPAPLIKAVEVDMPGCSYNPERESHQDALAVLVAAENRKLLQKELRPAPIPLALTNGQHDDQDELTMLQTEAAPDDDEEEEEEESGSGEGEGEAAGGSSGKKTAATNNKKTKKDRNREARAAAEAQLIEQRKALKRQRNMLEQLPNIVQEVQEEQQRHEAIRLRRQVVKEEKAATQPPRLGKQKFEDLSVQVLTSDEVGQGLRRLKAFPMLTTERFKSLQKRGLIEPRKPVGAKTARKKILYETGGRREKVQEGQASLEALKKSNRAAHKAAKQQR